MAKQNKATRSAVWVIIALLIVGLMGFGATNFGGTVDSVGRVGDREIGVQRYYNALQARLRGLSQQMGLNLTLAQAQEFGLTQQVLQETVSEVALENEAMVLGVAAGDARVRDQIISIPSFQNLEGEFDRTAYAETLRRSNLNERGFEADIRHELSGSIVQAAVVSGIDAPATYAETLMNYIAERRSFAWVALTEADLETPIADPTDSDLQEFYAANEAAFMLPETRKITYIWLTPAMLTDLAEIADEDVRALYDDRISEFVTPERRLVERLVLGDAAEDAKARLDAGEITFEELVAERDLQLSDIDLGDVTAPDLGAAGEGVFASSEPGVIGPFDSDFGPALFRVNAILAAQETTFEEASEGLREELALEEAAALIGDRLDGIDDLLAGGATLEEVASETDMELGQIDWFVGADGDVADYAAFAQIAAATQIGDFPEVEELDDGGIFALRVNEVIEPRLDNFENVREQAQAGWRAETVMAALAVQAETLAEGLRNGTDAAELGLEMTQETELTRDAFVAGAGAELIIRAFELAEGDVSIAVDSATAQVEILRVDAIQPPDDESEQNANRRNALTQIAAQSLSADILNAYARAIEAEAGISIDQAALNAVLAQSGGHN